MQKYKTYRKVGMTAVWWSPIVFPMILMTLAVNDVEAPVLYWTVGTAFFLTPIGGIMLPKIAETWIWKEAGRDAGLTPAEDGLPRDLSHRGKWVWTAPLSGRVRGRRVRARTYKSGPILDTHRKAEKVPFTIVEADLNQPADGGVIINATSGGFTDSAEGGPDAQNDALAAISDEETHAEALITGGAKEALLQVQKVGHVFVGDAERVFQDAIPDRDEFDMGQMVQSLWKNKDARTSSMHAGQLDIPGDEKTVTLRVQKRVLDPEELKQRIEAVVTVARAYERARTEDHKT